MSPSHTCNYSRPAGREIDLLIGMQYAGYQPVRKESLGHLLLLKNQFGHIIAGSNPHDKEKHKCWLNMHLLYILMLVL